MLKQESEGQTPKKGGGRAARTTSGVALSKHRKNKRFKAMELKKSDIEQGVSRYYDGK